MALSAAAATAAIAVTLLVGAAGNVPDQAADPAAPSAPTPATDEVAPLPATPGEGTPTQQAVANGDPNPDPAGDVDPVSRRGTPPELAIPADPWSTGPAVAATAVRTEGHLDAWAERPDGSEPSAAPAWQIPLRNEFGGPLHLLVLEDRHPWLRVQVPVRPNGTEAWIHHDEVQLQRIDHRMEIDLDARQLRVLTGDEVVFDTTVAIGRPSAPTPIGRFYLRDSFAWNPASVYGPYVLPLSAYSESIDAINGGEAVTAIHGTNRPDRLGEAVSLGCIRLSNDAITTLAHLVPPGTPVTIRRSAS